jgi:uncharacterized protein
MSEPLPESVDVEHLAREQAHLAGDIALYRMPRLSEAVTTADEAAWAEIEFAVDEGQRSRMTGEAAIGARLTCQRCLEPVDTRLCADIALVLARTADEADASPAGFSPLFWPSGAGSLVALIEDELLLALPVVARHRDWAKCGPVVDEGHFDNGARPQKPNPFAALEQLKSDGRGH